MSLVPLRQGRAGLKGYGVNGAFRNAFSAAIAALPLQQNGYFSVPLLLKAVEPFETGGNASAAS
jgi:hypothetical protein